MWYLIFVSIVLGRCGVDSIDSRRIFAELRGNCRYTLCNGNVTDNNDDSWGANFNVNRSSGQLKVNLKAPNVFGEYEIELIQEKSENCTSSTIYQNKDSDVHTVSRKICFEHTSAVEESSCKGEIALWFDWISTGYYTLRVRNADGTRNIQSECLTTDFNVSAVTLKTHFPASRFYSYQEQYAAGFGTLKFGIIHETSTEAWETVNTRNQYNISQMTVLVYDSCAHNDCNDSVDDVGSVAKCTLYRNDRSPKCSLKLGYVFGDPIVDVTKLGKDWDRVDWKFNISTKLKQYSVRAFLSDVMCQQETIWFDGMSADPCEEAIGVSELEIMGPTPTTYRPDEETKNSNLTESANFNPVPAAVGTVVPLLAVLCAALIYVLISRRRRSERRISRVEQDPIQKGNCGGILLLYFSDSPEFMELMEKFRESLKQSCQCDVHDWFDAGEGKEVATIGARQWAQDMLKSGKSVVWVDTKRARSNILDHLEKKKLAGQEQLAISDYRDAALPLILDFANSKMLDPNDQYRNHFVVRFEKFAAEEGESDPFSNISPHARYLMYQHFEQLCINLSMVKTADTNGEIEEKEKKKYMNLDEIHKGV